MNRTHLKHLLGSKWTHLAPVEREKHFVVTGVEKRPPESDGKLRVALRAVLSNRTRHVEIEALQDETLWKPDWR